MMKRALLMVVAAAAISAPAMITPAAAANLDVNLSLPGVAASVFAAPQPVYYAWGHPEYRRWEERRAWEREHFRREEWREHHWR
jgi:hypothetical protein